MLDGLTELSDATAESLSKYAGELSFGSLTSLSDAAAESLSKCAADELSLNGLTSLSDAAAESLSKCSSSLSLDGLTSLSDTAAESLSKCTDGFSLNGLTSLSDAAAESLSKCSSSLSLDGLTSLSDTAAESLSKKYQEGSIYLILSNQPESAAVILERASLGEGSKRFHVKYTRVMNEYTIYEIFADTPEVAEQYVNEADGEQLDRLKVVSEYNDLQVACVDAVWEATDDEG